MSFFPQPQTTWKDSARAATTGNITLSGLQTVDGVVLAGGDRVLVRQQNTPSQNGIYTAVSGAWNRSFDADDGGELRAGHAMYVSEGTTNARTLWANANTGTITIGTTNIYYTRTYPGYDSSPADPWDPSVLGHNIDREAAVSALTQPSGTLCLHGGMTLHAGATYSAINFFYTTASSALTHSWAGLVVVSAATVLEGASVTNAAARQLVAVSADNTAAISAGSWRTYTFASTLTPTHDIGVYFAHCLVATTTVPATAASPAAASAALNSQTVILVGTSNTAQTTPLAVNTVVTAPTVTTQLGFAYLS